MQFNYYAILSKEMSFKDKTQNMNTLHTKMGIMNYFIECVHVNFLYDIDQLFLICVILLSDYTVVNWCVCFTYLCNFHIFIVCFLCVFQTRFQVSVWVMSHTGDVTRTVRLSFKRGQTRSTGKNPRQISVIRGSKGKMDK